MSMTQITAEINPSGEARCSRCHSVLPMQAQFCVACGERVQRKSPLEDDSSIVVRYRKTSLLHRRPFVNLFLGADSRQRRQIALRDIDISSLSEDYRAIAYSTLQQEYDLLRQLNLYALMPAIDMGYFQGHLFTVAGWPTTSGTQEDEISLHTLQDILQSGKELPSLYIKLSWIEQICRVLANLHQQKIVVGDLDPHTLIFNKNDDTGSPALMISWLPANLYKLYAHIPSMNGPAHFAAPEVLLGHPEPRSDIYSLGAVLYLLLTGSPPEEPAQRIQHRLRPPGELDTRINSSLDDFVLQALSLDSSNRFESANVMLEALARLQTGSRKTPQSKTAASTTPAPAATHIEHESLSTASSDHSDQQAPEMPVSEFTVIATETPVPSVEDEGNWKHPDSEGLVPASSAEYEEESDVQVQGRTPKRQTTSFVDTFKQKIVGLLPSLRAARSATSAEQPNSRALVPITKQAVSSGKSAHDRPSLYKHIQNAFLGEQKRDTRAAAVIETPLRVQPQQAYTIRIQLMGRNKQQESVRENVSEGGISALAEGSVVHIEVRSVLYQNYAYVVQQANVTIPAEGYAAEVTIPMQPLTNGPSGRRDRLHVFFMDATRQPLYEKPFVLEIFISHLVQPGREGHNVLTIPL